MSNDSIVVRGARPQSERTSISISPHNQLTVVTGCRDRASRRSPSTRSTLRAAPLCRVAVSPCAAISGAHREARRRGDRRHRPGRCYQAEEHHPQSAIHRRHRDGNLRLPALSMRVWAGRSVSIVGRKSKDTVDRVATAFSLRRRNSRTGAVSVAAAPKPLAPEKVKGRRPA